MKSGKCSLAKFANFLLIIVLRAAIATIFEPKVVAISARNTIMRKFANFGRLYFPHIIQHFQPNFGILLFLKGSFQEFRFYFLDQKLVYNAIVKIDFYSLAKRNLFSRNFPNFAEKMRSWNQLLS